MDLVLEFLITFLFIIGNVALGTFVAVRAWDHTPARVFVVVIFLLTTMGVSIFGQSIFLDPASVYVLRSLMAVHMGFFSTAFVALLSAMFMPIWWQGRRPIIWILSPYVLISVILTIDLFGHLGIFVAGLSITEADITFNTTILGRWLLVLLSISWLVPLAMVATAWVRNQHLHLPIMVLVGSMIISFILNSLRLSLNASPTLRGIILLIPLPLALAFAVFRTRLLTPMRAALDQAFAVMSDIAMVLNEDDRIVYTNQQAMKLGFHTQESLRVVVPALNSHLDLISSAYAGGMNIPLEIQGRRVLFSLSSLTDEYNHAIGTLVMGRDVTEIEERTLQLEEERGRLALLVTELETEQRERSALSATIEALVLPIIPILKGVIVLPLVGSFDTARMRDLRFRLLEAIERQRANLVILDMTGLSFLDEQGAVGLTRNVQAARLLGAECRLVGVRPEIAEAIVAQGLAMEDIRTAATLQEAVEQTMKRTKPAQG